MATEEKKFDGQVYYLVDRGFTKLKAIAKSKELHKKGYKCRIIMEKTGWTIYRRHRGK